MADAERSGFKRSSAAAREMRRGEGHCGMDEALRAIVRALAREAAREVFERESQSEIGHSASEDTR
jgi:hypothetical protein